MSQTALSLGSPTSAARRALGRHADALLASLLLVVGLVVFWPALGVRPGLPDNVVSLTLARRDSPWSFWSHPIFSFQPTYRPFPFTVLWIQGHVAAFHISLYYLVNIVIWIACGWLVYAIVRHISGTRIFAVLAALAVLFDERSQWALVVIEERQTSIAVLTGLSALLLTLHLESFRRRRLALAAVGVLLLLASLSIEYGLAFSAAVFVAGLLASPGLRRPLVAVAVVAVLAYAGLHLGLAGGVSSDYCESMGYFTHQRPDPTCLSSLSTAVQIKQFVYNVGAGSVGIVLPTLFSFDGVWKPFAREKYELLASLIVFALALLALARRPRATAPLLALWIANAVLGFYLFRSRNQIVGMIGIYASAGIGAAELVGLIRARRPNARVAVVGVTLVIVGWLAFSGLRQSNGLRDFRARELQRDPCSALTRYPKDASRDIVIRIKRLYGMSNPDCAG